MTNFSPLILKQDSKRLGDFHSFWLPGTPKDGEFWSITKEVRGDMPINMGHKRNTRGIYASGGPWLMHKRTFKRNSSSAMVCDRGNGALGYNGHFEFTNWANGSNQYVLSQEEVLQNAYAFGAEAMLALRPDLPDFSAGMAVLELKDVFEPLKERTSELARKVRDRMRKKGMEPKPVRIPKSESGMTTFNKSRKAGAEWFLAAEMGWIPLLSDIAKASIAYAGRTKRFEQVVRDEGKPVRRRKHLSVVSEKTYEGSFDFVNQPNNPDIQPTFVTYMYPPTYPHFGYPWPYTHWTGQYTRKVWVSGKSRYHLPPGPHNDAWTAEVQRRVFGFKWLTPSNAYNLIPWSWLADYFSDLGTFLEATNPEAISDSWYAEYAFIMDWRRHVATDEAIQYVSTGTNQFEPVSAERLIIEDYKVRSQASIFGWGFSQDDLSPKQLGIMGALGLSRL